MKAVASIGILGAIPQEVNGIIAQLSDVIEHEIGNRVYYEGRLNNQPVVVVYSRIGKVAAAATVTTLLLKFNVKKIVFVGVAGSIHEAVNVGDVVIATKLLQHDMDCSPLRPKYEVPLLGKIYFDADTSINEQAKVAVNHVLQWDSLVRLIGNDELSKFAITQPKLHMGTIASGDQFIGKDEQKQALQAALPEVLCVEMEGAAVAQVCDEFNVPFAVIRTISDKANQEASFSFQSFVEKISLVYGREMMQKLFS